MAVPLGLTSHFEPEIPQNLDGFEAILRQDHLFHIHRFLTA